MEKMKCEDCKVKNAMKDRSVCSGCRSLRELDLNKCEKCKKNSCRRPNRICETCLKEGENGMETILPSSKRPRIEDGNETNVQKDICMGCNKQFPWRVFEVNQKCDKCMEALMEGTMAAMSLNGDDVEAMEEIPMEENLAAMSLNDGDVETMETVDLCKGGCGMDKGWTGYCDQCAQKKYGMAIYRKMMDVKTKVEMESAFHKQMDDVVRQKDNDTREDQMRLFQNIEAMPYTETVKWKCNNGDCKGEEMFLISELAQHFIVEHKISYRHKGQETMCMICVEGFKANFTWCHHMLTRHTNMCPFVCLQEGCNKTFTSKEGLALHMNTIHESGKVICGICEDTGDGLKSFGSMTFLYVHLATDHNGHHCGGSLYTYNTLREKYTADGKCPFEGCDYKWSPTGGGEDMNYHLNVKHDVFPKGRVYYWSHVDQSLICDYKNGKGETCRVEFENTEELERHKDIYHTLEGMCVQDGCKIKGPFNLYHRRKEHRQNHEIGLQTWGLCNGLEYYDEYKFLWNSSLQEKEGKRKCSFCGVAKRTYENIKYHLNSQCPVVKAARKKWQKCSTCGKYYDNLWELFAHNCLEKCRGCNKEVKWMDKHSRLCREFKSLYKLELEKERKEGEESIFLDSNE